MRAGGHDRISLKIFGHLDVVAHILCPVSHGEGQFLGITIDADHPCSDRDGIIKGANRIDKPGPEGLEPREDTPIREGPDFVC